MTSPGHARRIRWLVASIAAILGLAAILRATEARLDAVSTRNAVGRKPTTWVTLDGVEYRPIEEASPAQPGHRRTHRASVEACDPASGRRLWKVTVREGTWAEGMGVLFTPPRSAHDHFLAGFALKLAVIGEKVSVTSRDGATYLIDPRARRVLPLRSANPPPRPPVLDIRRDCGTHCEVHDRACLEGLVPIRYGFIHADRETYQIRRARFPNANASCAGGCLIGESREARVFYCPDCRSAEREWLEEAATRRADDGG